MLPDYEFGRGDAPAALARAPHRLEGQLRIGGQEHFYLEGQAALAIPGEAREMLVHSSTQDPTEVAAHRGAHPRPFPTLSSPSRRAAWAAASAARRARPAPGRRSPRSAAHVTGRPCKVRLDRDDDFALTGKRHDFRADWRVGYDDKGVVAPTT